MVCSRQRAPIRRVHFCEAKATSRQKYLRQRAPIRRVHFCEAKATTRHIFTLVNIQHLCYNTL